MSYSGSPTAGSTDEVRLLIGDTDTSDELLTDAELQYFIDTFGSGISAAVQACNALMAKFARFVDSSVGDVSESASQRVTHYQQLGADLENRLAQSAPIYAGGVNLSETQAADSDASLIQQTFKRGQFDNPNSNPINELVGE